MGLNPTEPRLRHSIAPRSYRLRSSGGGQLDPNVYLPTEKQGRSPSEKLKIVWRTPGIDAYGGVAHSGFFEQDERLETHKPQ